MITIHCRLAATEVMKRLESAYRSEEDPYGKINLVDLISKSEREVKPPQSISSTTSSEDSSLKHQIEAIKVSCACVIYYSLADKHTGFRY